MREPSKPSVIREEEDLTTRTLGRKPGFTSTTAINSNSSIDRRKHRSYSDDREGSYDPVTPKRYNNESDRYLKVPGATTNLGGGGKYSTIDTRYSPEKISYSPQRYDEYDGYNNNTLTKRGRNITTVKQGMTLFPKPICNYEEKIRTICNFRPLVSVNGLKPYKVWKHIIIYLRTCTDIRLIFHFRKLFCHPRVQGVKEIAMQIF